MRLKADAIVMADRGAQAGVAGERQVMHGHGCKFDTGLHDETADVADVGKGRHMRVERSARGLRRGGGDIGVVIVARTAGGRDFGADDIEEIGVCGVTADAPKVGGAGHGDAVVELGGLSCAAFGAVEVDLGEAGLHIVAHEEARLGHCLIGGEAAPDLWPEVIAAKDDAGAVGFRLVGEGVDEGDEIGGGHAGVAAVLIDLI